MRGDLKFPRGYGIKVRVNRMSGVGCVAGVPSALAMRRGWGGRPRFLFSGWFAVFVVLDC